LYWKTSRFLWPALFLIESSDFAISTRHGQPIRASSEGMYSWFRKATARQTKAGLAVVEFEGYSYLSRVRGGKWELDWQVLDEYVAFRGRDGILHVWRVGGAAT